MPVAVSKQLRVEEEVPIKKKGGYLLPDENKLRRLGAAGDQVLLVLGELMSGFAQKLFRTASSVSMIRRDVFLNTRPEFPLLLSSDVQLILGQEQLKTEIGLVVDMQQMNLFEGPHIYGVRVLEPAGYRLERPPMDLREGTLIELRSGYIHHDVLYRHTPETRGALLDALLSRAEVVEVIVRPPGENTLRKTVTVARQP